jgi:hypothetical protein
MIRIQVRPLSILAVIIMWNALILLDLLVLGVEELPGPGSVLALLGLASVSGLLPVSKKLQQWVLRPAADLGKLSKYFCYGLCALCLAILLGGLILLWKK